MTVMGDVGALKGLRTPLLLLGGRVQALGGKLIRLQGRGQAHSSLRAGH